LPSNVIDSSIHFPPRPFGDTVRHRNAALTASSAVAEHVSQHRDRFAERRLGRATACIHDGRDHLDDNP
jgi:hypothetical protein